MNILFVHNRYQQPGGEDVVVGAEAALLRQRGHQVTVYEACNDTIAANSTKARLQTAAIGIWNRRSHRELRTLIRRTTPAVMHCHNIFPLISPAAYYAAAAEAVPVVQTLHNYRLQCVNALLFREGRPCEECVGRLPLSGVVHACYRGSHLGSAAVAVMLCAHRIARTWQDRVQRYIAPTSFAKARVVAGGIPEERIIVKPNFVDPDPGEGNHDGSYAFYAGRLSPEKGVQLLLDGWRALQEPIPLRVAGDGPLRPEVERAAAHDSRIQYVGMLTRRAMLTAMKAATLLVQPSLVYETFGMAVLEAFATGLPAIVPDHGALNELVDSQRTGWHFRAGDAGALAHVVRIAWASRTVLRDKGSAARREYQRRFTADANYVQLLDVYTSAIHALRR